MCAVFGFLDYKSKISNTILKKLIQNLSIAAEVRGTDATGISYVNHGKVVTFKKAKPAHKVKLYFPKNTRAVIGHTRMTTQGSEKYNYNNHPFEGQCGTETFALAHNGVLYNDAELKTKWRSLERQRAPYDGKYSPDERRNGQLCCRAIIGARKAAACRKHQENGRVGRREFCLYDSQK